MRDLQKWMFTAMLMMCGVMMTTLSSCSNDDNSNGSAVSPEDKLRAEFYEKIKGTRVDNSMDEILGYIRAYDVREDGTMDILMFDQLVSDEDDEEEEEAAENESDYNINYISAKWKPIASHYSDYLDDSYPALAVDCKLLLQENANGDIVEIENFEWSDTIFIVPSDVEGDVFLWNSDFDEIIIKYSGRAGTRGFFSDLINKIKSGVQVVVSATSTVANNIRNAVVDSYKAVKNAVTSAVHFVGKAVFNSYPVTIKGNSDWMGTIYKDVNPLIREMSIPGTHDTFTYDFGKIVGQWASTQVYNIDEQFDAGVRFFDMRFKGSGANTSMAAWGGLWLSHGLITNISAELAFSKIAKLLKAHPQETVICQLTFEDGDSQELVNRLNEALKDVRTYVMDASLLHGDIRLNDCRGKMIIIQRFKDTFTNGNFGFVMSAGSRNEIGSLTVNGKSSPLMEQDLWECDLTNTNNKEEFNKTYNDYVNQKSDLLTQNLNDARNPKDPNCWHLNFTSGYFKYTGQNVLEKSWVVDINFVSYIPILDYPSSAHIMNKKAFDYIVEHAGEKTGIIAMDFAGLNTEGALTKTDVYGDVLVNAIVGNNKELIRKGALQ